MYGKYIDCQWLEITGVPKGNYLIEVVIDRTGIINQGPNVFPDSIDVPVVVR